MHSPDKIDEYIDSICQQIRWKRAQPRISNEMRDHIEDGRDVYIKQGLDEQEATEKAIIDTGDAVELGTQFDRIHRPKPQWGMLIAIECLVAFGLLVSVFVFGNDVNEHNRLSFAIIGILIMYATHFADFTLLGKRPLLTYWGIALAVIIGIFLLPINQMSLARTQSVTLILPLAFAALIFWARNKGYRGLVSCGLGYGLLCFIALLLSAAGFFHFVLIGVILLLAAIWRGWFGVRRLYGSLMVCVPFVLCIFIGLTAVQGWLSVRLMTVFNPNLDPLGFGFVGIQARQMLSGAELFGEGATDGVYLWPGIMSSDLLLTALISLWGWIPFAAIMGVLAIFIAFGLTRCFRQRSGLGFLVSLAVMLTFSVQTVMYVIYNLGFLFVQISLPLISFGNTAMVVNLALLGFMLSVFRSGHVAVEDNAVYGNKADDSMIKWESGKLIITLRKTP